jgi:hypothetical protein
MAEINIEYNSAVERFSVSRVLEDETEKAWTP